MAAIQNTIKVVVCIEIKYLTPAEAEAVIETLVQMGLAEPGCLEPWPCPACGGYHLRRRR